MLPVLGALPDSLIILSSLSASQAEAQEQIAVGVGAPTQYTAGTDALVGAEGRRDKPIQPIEQLQACKTQVYRAIGLL